MNLFPKRLRERLSSFALYGPGQEKHHDPKLAREFWRRFLDTEDATDLSDSDWMLAAKLAGSWNTCACGSINDGLPRSSIGGEPRDTELFRMGMEFMRLIQQRKLPEAQKMFMKINEQGAQVLIKMQLPESVPDKS
jgi:hypothetical protein